MKRHQYAWVISIFLAMFLSISASHAQENTTTTPKGASFDFKEFTGDKTFHLNTLQTTKYGPAWADITVTSSNFLECTGASIALCYYSGEGPVTPCTSKDNIANCTCYAIPAGEKYKVDINAILNLDVYLQTVKTCGKDGSKCKPKGSIVAPVCDAINNNTLIPGADTVSAFSTYLEREMPISPESCPASTYAGCMTAPCKDTGKVDPKTKLPLVQCACPEYNGPYQVGQKNSQCTLENNQVWSAAYNAKAKSSNSSNTNTAPSTQTSATTK